MQQVADRGVALRHVLTRDTSADVDVADYLVALAKDPACDAPALDFEGRRDPTKLDSARDRTIQAGERVAMCQVGRSVAGREAARS